MRFSLSFLTRTCGPVVALAVSTVAAAPESGTREDTGLKYWQWNEGGISLLVEQRLPDQTRAFFLARGFTSEAANVIGDGCVFKTDLRNPAAAGSVIDYDLSQWRVVVDGQRKPMMLKDQWDDRWKAMNLPSPPRIAFRWALLPNRQRLDPGDYNWGMSAFGFPAGQRFDLEFTWLRNGEERTGIFQNVECAPDVESLVPREGAL
ncbi:MAG: hypothetical protein U9R74_20215 [Pseudomonadota bacterium]|nr:hypothetical protein [Pseudomonadota bacterium]